LVVAGLELLVTVLLAQNQQPPPTVAACAPHANLAAKLISMPSGLLAMVCEAIVKLKVRHGAAGTHASGGVGPYAEELPRVVLDALQVSDVVRAGRDSHRTGPLRRSSRLSTLMRAGASA
jgi:hypothetical protein